MNGTIDPSLLALFAEVASSGGVRGAALKTEIAQGVQLGIGR